MNSWAASDPVPHPMAQVIPHPPEVAQDLPFRSKEGGGVWKAPMLVEDRARQYGASIPSITAKRHDRIEGLQGMPGGLKVIKGF